MQATLQRKRTTEGRAVAILRHRDSITVLFECQQIPTLGPDTDSEELASEELAFGRIGRMSGSYRNNAACALL